ncbi:MAG: NUDIX domain-containing protein [Patescibacteria group bacterium]
MSQRKDDIMIGVGAVVEHPDFPGRILMVQEARNNKKIGKKRGMLSVPSGHLERDESPAERAILEIQEETGYRNIKLIGFQGLYVVKGGLLGIVYQAEVSGEPGKRQEDEIKKVVWMEPEKILADEKNLRPAIKEIVQDYLVGRPLLPLKTVRICF